MIKSMTGFGGKEAKISSLGNVTVEIRSTNHKFLETVLHLPDGLASLEERVKKEIEAKIKRGRITCTINVLGGLPASVMLNQGRLKNYLTAIKDIRGRFNLGDQLSLDTLIHLPGVLSLVEKRIPHAQLWRYLKRLVKQALEDLVKMRQKEGQALSGYLKVHLRSLKLTLEMINRRFKKIIKDKLSQIKTDEERSLFLKDTDITEEIERLTFHLRNFSQKLSKSGPMGKELDFIAQEMQREANTIGAKSCDVVISTQVIQIKSQIEKIREQVQNIE